jgi:hypothetical protein
VHSVYFVHLITDPGFVHIMVGILQKPAMKNFFLRQQAWVVDVETRAKGRGAEIAKCEAVKSAEKV